MPTGQASWQAPQATQVSLRWKARMRWNETISAGMTPRSTQTSSSSLQGTQMQMGQELRQP